MTTKYTRNTLVPFGTLKHYAKLSSVERDRVEAILDPELLALPREDAENREFPVHAFTRAVALGGIDYATVSIDDSVLIREATLAPAEAGKLELRVGQGDYRAEVPMAIAADFDQLIGLELTHWLHRRPRVVVDVYQCPRSGRFYLALAYKEES